MFTFFLFVQTLVFAACAVFIPEQAPDTIWWVVLLSLCGSVLMAILEVVGAPLRAEEEAMAISHDLSHGDHS